MNVVYICLGIFMPLVECKEEDPLKQSSKVP